MPRALAQAPNVRCRRRPAAEPRPRRFFVAQLPLRCPALHPYNPCSPMLPAACWPVAAAVAILAAVGAAPAAAQDWRVVDRPTPTSAITYEATRQRLQVLDQRQELYEIDDKD